MKKTFLILALLFTSIQIIIQQPRPLKYIYDEISLKDGFRAFTEMYQDKNGFIWLGGSYGLQRYDGYEFVNYDQIKDELGWIFHITEDSRGILWIATNKGIYLLNPKNEKLEHYHSGPDSPVAYKVLEDKKGVIWCAADTGLLKIEPKINNKQEINELIFEKGMEAAFSITVLNLTETLAAKINGSKIISPFELFEDSRQRLWIGTYPGQGLFVFNRETNEFTRMDDDEKGKSRLYHPSVYTIVEENPDVLWVRTYNAFTRVSNIKQAFSKTPVDKAALKFDTYLNRMDFEGEGGTTQNMFLIDRQHNFWFGTWNNGLFNLKVDDEKRITFEALYTELPELQRDLYNGVTTLMEDRTGLLWIRFYMAGIMKLRTANRVFYPLEGILGKQRLSSYFTHIYEDEEGNLWISTWLDGLYKISRAKEISNFKIIDPEKRDAMENHIETFLEIEKGLFWIGGLGIWQFDAKTRTCRKLFVKPDETIQSYVNNLLKIEHHVLIPTYSQVGDAQGLWLFDLNSEVLKKYTVHQDDTLGLKSNNIFSINKLRNGEIWVSTGNNGLCRVRLNMKTGELDFLPLPEAVNTHRKIILEDSRYIYKIYEDKMGILWFGTAKGLIRLDLESGNLDKWTEKDGIVSGVVDYIEEDKEGNLWLISRYGLCMLEPKTGRIKTYDEKDGLPHYGVWAPFKNKDGLIYFVGRNGFCSFNPDNIQKNDVVPSIVITDFKIFNKSVRVDSSRDAILKQNISYTREINLKYNQNDLSFTFAALDYNDPSKNRYAYMLEGYQHEWTETGADNRIATYTNLNPGEYIFRVKGSNNDGVWNEVGASVHIIINPPFWKTIMAYIAYAVLFLFLIRSYIYWRTSRIRKEKEVLEKQVNERTGELKTANIRLEEHQKEIEEVNALLEEQKEELMQQKEELQSTLENLQKTQAQLVESEKMAAVGGLVAGVAHEMSTPLGISITANSNLLDDVQKMAGLYEKGQISRKEFKEFLESTNDTAKITQKNLERAASLIQSFKQVSTDQVTEQQRVFALKEYLNDILLSLRPKFREKELKFEIDCDDKLHLNSYPGVYAQIFTNLLLNSLQHGFAEKESGTIGIKAEISKGSLNIRYTDDGAGISKKDLPHIFEPFYTSDQHFGTGLGLNIIYNLVKQKLHGTITCESEPGNGVVFAIEVPV